MADSKMFKHLFKKRVGLENKIIEEIDIVLSLIETMGKTATEPNSFIIANNILELETVLDKQEQEFIEQINKQNHLPDCWEELFKISNSLKQLFKQLSMAFNKIQIFKDNESYFSFYEHEKRFLFNIKNFIYEYVKNRKYAYQLVVNNQHELKDFMKIYYTKLNAAFGGSPEHSDIKIKMLEIFQQINKINEEVQETVTKIYVSSGV